MKFDIVRLILSNNLRGGGWRWELEDDEGVQGLEGRVRQDGRERKGKGIGAEKSERQASGKGGKAPALAGGTGWTPVVDDWLG